MIYLYTSNKPKELKTEIFFNTPSEQLFEDYSLAYPAKQIREEYITIFYSNIFIIDNLEKLLNEVRGYEEFKEFLKTHNIQAKYYFANRLTKNDLKKRPNDHSVQFIYTSILDGPIFLDQYINFVKKLSTDEIKKRLILKLEKKIYIYEKNYEIAKLINLEKPLLLETSQEINYKVFYHESDLYFKGTKVLRLEISLYYDLIQKIKKDQFTYQVIADSATAGNIISTSPFLYSLIGSIFVFSLSLIIIIFRIRFK